MITEIKGKCQYEECERPATHIACGRSTRTTPQCYCERHAYEVCGKRFPEYQVGCPNCGCLFGVN